MLSGFTTSLGYTIYEATLKDEIETHFKVMCGQGHLKEVSAFLPKSTDIDNYIAEHTPESVC